MEVLLQQHVMRRRNTKGGYAFEQYNIYYNNDAGDYTGKLYRGTSRNSMRLVGTVDYATQHVMEERVRLFVRDAEADGFEYLDRVIHNFVDVPLANFNGFVVPKPFLSE